MLWGQIAFALEEVCLMAVNGRESLAGEAADLMTRKPKRREGPGMNVPFGGTNIQHPISDKLPSQTVLRNDLKPGLLPT